MEDLDKCIFCRGRQRCVASRPWIDLILNCLQTIVGAVAIQTSDLALDPPPLKKIEDVCRLFQNAAETSSPALSALVSIIRTRDSRTCNKLFPTAEIVDVASEGSSFISVQH
jgi:hypothetical protein